MQPFWITVGCSCTIASVKYCKRFNLDTQAKSYENLKYLDIDKFPNVFTKKYLRYISLFEILKPSMLIS